MDHQRPHARASLGASPHQGHRPRRRIVVRLVAEGAVVVALLASGWWGMSLVGAHALALESSAPAPVYVAGCPVDDTLQKGSAGGGCSKEGASHPISSRQPGAGLASEHAHGAEK